jgi:hypothetical protein
MHLIVHSHLITIRHSVHSFKFISLDSHFYIHVLSCNCYHHVETIWSHHKILNAEHWQTDISIIVITAAEYFCHHSETWRWVSDCDPICELWWLQPQHCRSVLSEHYVRKWTTVHVTVRSIILNLTSSDSRSIFTTQEAQYDIRMQTNEHFRCLKWHCQSYYQEETLTESYWEMSILWGVKQHCAENSAASDATEQDLYCSQHHSTILRNECVRQIFWKQAIHLCKGWGNSEASERMLWMKHSMPSHSYSSTLSSQIMCLRSEKRASDIVIWLNESRIQTHQLH